MSTLNEFQVELEAKFPQTRGFHKMRPLRGSERLTREMWSDSISYRRVTSLHADGTSTLDCGHLVPASERNPAEMGQVRFCGTCTEAKFEAMGGNQ